MTSEQTTERLLSAEARQQLREQAERLDGLGPVNSLIVLDDLDALHALLGEAEAALDAISKAEPYRVNERDPCIGMYLQDEDGTEVRYFAQQKLAALCTRRRRGPMADVLWGYTDQWGNQHGVANGVNDMTGDTKEDAVVRARRYVLSLIPEDIHGESFDEGEVDALIAAARAEGAREAEALVRRLVGALEALSEYRQNLSTDAYQFAREQARDALASPLVTAIMERGEEETHGR